MNEAHVKLGVINSWSKHFLANKALSNTTNIAEVGARDDFIRHQLSASCHNYCSISKEAISDMSPGLCLMFNYNVFLT